MAEGVCFSDDDMQRLTLLARTAGEIDLGVVCTLSYALLFRVQSEMLPLEAGSAQELTTGLPSDRHSAVCVRDEKLHVRFRRRKHRPNGSLLVRNCVCSQVLDERLSPVHCVNWAAITSEDKVVNLTPSAAQHKLRRLAKLCGIPGAASATLKVFRSSKATNLALAGKPLHAILQAGEWRSEVVLRYCSEDSLDKGALIQTSVNESDGVAKSSGA